MAEESRKSMNPDPVNVQTTDSSNERRSNNNLPNFLLSVRLKYVKLDYHYLIFNAMYLMLVPLLCIASAYLSTQFMDLVQLWDQLKFNLVSVTLCLVRPFEFLSHALLHQPSRKVYLVDFACYKPEPERICTREIFMERSALPGSFTDENLAFQKKILESSTQC